MAEIQGTCDARFERVRGAFEQNFQTGGEVGASVAIRVNGETVVDLWGGHADAARTRAWERDTIANVYSTTKGITAICAHQLLERGELELDAPVAKYWPEFAAAGKERLPVRYLLSHQAGLTGVSHPLPEEALYDWERMTRALAEQKPWWEPGTQHGYHAITFGYLVGELVRRVSGKSLGSYFREQIAEPLGADFQIGLPSADDARTADMIPAPPPDPNAAPPAEGPLAELMKDMLQFQKDMTDPTTLTGAAFSNPAMKEGTVNSRAWRAAEIPAANGHGNARALAPIYGVLAAGGSQDGVHVLSRESIERALAEQAFGPDAILRLPMRFGLGFMLRHDLMPFGPNPRTFGHPGAGGSVGFADPDAGIGFGYVMNQMQQTLVGGAGAFALIGATYASL